MATQTEPRAGFVLLQEVTHWNRNGWTARRFLAFMVDKETGALHAALPDVLDEEEGRALAAALVRRAAVQAYGYKADGPAITPPAVALTADAFRDTDREEGRQRLARLGKKSPKAWPRVPEIKAAAARAWAWAHGQDPEPRAAYGSAA